MVHMRNVCVTMGDKTLEMIDEIAGALELVDGHKPNRSHVIRMAVATMVRAYKNPDIESTRKLADHV